MKKLILLCACLLALGAGAAPAVAGDPEIVLVSILYNPSKSFIVITRGEGKSEMVEVTAGRSEKNVKLQNEAYYKVVQQLYREGYVLSGQLPGLDYPTYSTAVFAKVPKP